MTETKQPKVSDFENSSSFLVKERALMDDFSDEFHGALGSANSLIEDVASQSKGFNATYYTSLSSAFDETATEFTASTSNTTDSLTADHRTSEIGREDALDAQNKQIREEAKAEEEAKMEEETEQEDDAEDEEQES